MSEHGHFGQIPEVDLGPWLAAPQDPDKHAELLECLRHICHEVGFFYIINHGIDETEMARYLGALKAFFDLPELVKSAMDKSHSPHFRGWERLGSELTNNEVDYREQVDIGTERAAIVDPSPFYWCLVGPNQWPEEARLPGFQGIVLSFLEKLQAVAHRLLALMSASLGLEPGHIGKVFGDQPQPYCKLIRYPPTPGGSRGVGAHKDSGFLTLLLQDEVGGLQARNIAGDWVEVHPRPGRLVVNIGELLQIMTHNYFVATPHRVINQSPTAVRYSSAYFYSPDLDTLLEPLPITRELVAAAQASERHRDAGLMTSRKAMLAGAGGIGQAEQVSRFGEKYWQRWVRSYPGIARKFYPQYVE